MRNDLVSGVKSKVENLTSLHKTRENKAINLIGGFGRFWGEESNPATRLLWALSRLHLIYK